MASISNEALVLAKVYARSMLDLAEQVGEGDFLMEELRDLSQIMEQDKALERFFCSPTVDAKTREASIEKIFRGRASDLLVNSLQVLNRKDRLSYFPAVVEAYRRAHQELRGRVEVQVRSAIALSDEARDRIREITARYAGKEVTLVEKVDDNLMGGLVIQMGDDKFDSSMTRKIAKLSASLRERAIGEMHADQRYVEN